MAAARPLTKRDIAVLQMVYSYEGATVEQIKARVFRASGNKSAAYRRIKVLRDAGYLTGERIPSLSGIGSGKAFVTTGPAARPILAELLGVPRNELARVRTQSPFIVQHHLAIGDFRISLENACERSPSLVLRDWISERELRRERASSHAAALVPDASFILSCEDEREQTFWLEMDMGTMSSKRLLAKLRGYLTLGGTSIPILFCTLDTARAKQILELALKAGAQLARDPTIIWSAAKSELTPQRILDDRLWSVAGGPTVSILGLTGATPTVSGSTKGTLFFRKEAA